MWKARPNPKFSNGDIVVPKNGKMALNTMDVGISRLDPSLKLTVSGYEDISKMPLLLRLIPTNYFTCEETEYSYDEELFEKVVDNKAFQEEMASVSEPQQA